MSSLDADIDKYVPRATDVQRAAIQAIYERVEPDPGCPPEIQALHTWLETTCARCREPLPSLIRVMGTLRGNDSERLCPPCWQIILDNGWPMAKYAQIENRRGRGE